MLKVGLLKWSWLIWLLPITFNVNFLMAQDTANQLLEKATNSNFRTIYDWNQIPDHTIESYQKLDLLLFFLTNEYRIKKKKKPLTFSSELQLGAHTHSAQMVELHFFDHENKKNKRLKTPTDRARLAGVSNPFAAENIATFQDETIQTYLQIAEKLLDIWIHSPPHNANLLSKDALQLGCGVVNSNGAWMATQLFQWFSPIQVGPVSLTY